MDLDQPAEASLPPPTTSSSSPQSPGSPEAVAPVAARDGAGRAIGVLALLLAALALGIVTWQWFESRDRASALSQELGRRLAEANSTSDQARLVADQSRESARAAENKLSLVESKLAESQNQQVALEALYQELSRNRDDWTLAEVEQILLIASQQLQLAGNVKAALIALQSAENRLQRIDQAQLAPLRKVVEKDIEKLKALPFPDIVGISEGLDKLAAAVGELPLAQNARPRDRQSTDEPSATRGDDNRFIAVLRSAWGEFKDLIRIERIEQPQPPLLSANESFFLRENLRLRLLSARLALLARDHTSFETDLKAARDWLNSYFDARDKAVTNALAGLQQLLEADIRVELPTISDSLEAVRNYKPAREPGSAE